MHRRPARKLRQSVRCFVIVPTSREYAPVMKTVILAAKEANVTITHTRFPLRSSEDLREILYSEIAEADLVLADVSDSSPAIFYEIGLAHSLGKLVFLLINDDAPTTNLSDMEFLRTPFLKYSKTTKGLKLFHKALIALLRDLKLRPRMIQTLLPYQPKSGTPLYAIQPERLSPREFENLCFELLTQMGLRRVEWGVELRGIDLIASLPTKDPDGYQYEQIWLVAIGKGGDRRFPTELLLEAAVREPEYFLDRIFGSPETREFASRVRSEATLTFLAIPRNEDETEYYEEIVRKFRRKTIAGRSNVRVRVWGSRYLAGLIQQYPQIAYKYFSEETRTKGEYRKGYEDLYKENVELTERIRSTASALEEEKKRRFVAEREAAWKDVAFKAAHKLGNPIDAVDTFLPSLRKRIQNSVGKEAIGILDDIAVSIEEAKRVIAQFKSLTKAQQMNTRPIYVKPLINHACKMAEQANVKVEIEIPEDCPQLMADPDRVSECFNELVANSIHWFDKAEKKIAVHVGIAKKKDLPEVLDKTKSYLRIQFKDNGCGIPMENKEKIFSPFFTTCPHGTGLGLSLVKWIVEGHGGVIFENGEPGKGASFEMFLPSMKIARG